jgi:hypothetical protein
VIAPEEAVQRPAPVVTVRDGAPAGPSLPGWAGAAAVVAVAAVWLALRPSSPQGAAAAVDLLVLPALLLAEGRLLAGRPTIPLTGFAILFGLGAVFASVAALLLEWPAEHWLSASTSGAFGSMLEVVAPAAPVVAMAVLLLNDDRRPTMSDLALAGLASGTGFLVVQTSLVAAASHRAPHEVSALVAGWQRAPTLAGVGPAYFVGPGVATALIGLTAGAAVRWRGRPWRLVPPLLTLGVVVLDRVGFERQLRHAATGQLPPASGLVDVVRRVTLSGRIELVLLVLGLALIRGEEVARWWSTRRPAPGAERPGPGTDAPGADPEPEAWPNPATARSGALLTPADPGADHAAAASPVRTTDLAVGAASAALAVCAGVVLVGLARTRHLGFLHDRPVALAVAAVGFSYSVLRLAALRSTAVMPAARRARSGAPAPTEDGETGPPADGLPTETPAVPFDADVDHVDHIDEMDDLDPSELMGPGDEGRQLLCMAAMAAGAVGLVCAIFASTAAVRPIGGGLVVDAARAWAAHVGNLGLLLGIGGLAAPPGPLMPTTAGGWRDLLPWRIRSSGWWASLAPRSHWWGGLAPRGGWAGWSRLRQFRSGAGGGWLGGTAFGRRLRRLWSGGDGEDAGRLGWRGWWRRMSGAAGVGDLGRSAHGRLPWRSGRWRPGQVPEETDPERSLTTTVTIEPVEKWERSRTEYVGATVQEAMQSALRDHDVGLGLTALQLVDTGLPDKPGKPGSGRPARVRVVRGTDAAEPLLPPGRDSITRATPVKVVVEVLDPVAASVPMVDGARVVTAAEPGPPSITVTLSNPSRPSEMRDLTCFRDEASPGIVRYRSHPYSVDDGEDVAWAAGSTPAEALGVGDGEPLRAEHDGEAATVMVYDGWPRQVIAINRALFDIAAAHHVTALAALGQEPGTSAIEVIERHKACLAAAEEGRRLLSSPAPDDEKAFLTTALLHRAMSLDGSGPDVGTAAAALGVHRRAVSADPAQDVATGPYRALLDSTVVGRLWAAGAASPDAVGEVLGWSPATDGEPDP